MTTTTTSTPAHQKIQPGRLESVAFHDGMIVNASDLDAAMQYPASMLRLVLQAFFGCGVLCGLELHRPGTDPTFKVCVTRGVAIDGNGDPVELCANIELDLTPDPCDTPQSPLYIAIRRITSDELPRDPCAVDTGDTRYQCTRRRDHTIVRAFTQGEVEALGNSLCTRPAPSKDDTSATTSVRECLTHCDCHGCSEASWVLLGSVVVNKDRVDVNGPDSAVPGLLRRKLAKVIECLNDLEQRRGADLGKST